ncbi:MAG: DUF3943 domain-containing protein [Nitrospira sp.]|nr:DUF3943 domain-containing protein [Nitrospira sp.]
MGDLLGIRTSRRVRQSGLLVGIAVLSVSFLPIEMSFAEEVSPGVQGPPSPYSSPSSGQSSAGPGIGAFSGRIRDWQGDTLNWETGAGRSYVLPIGEILLYEFLLNMFDRHFVDPTADYQSNGSTIWNHITDPQWVVDNDPFRINQFLHPYGGSVYYGLARSTGLNFWESMLYSVGGSFLWEIAGETTNPSINDMIATPIGGTFLGEPFFRMASLLLEGSDGKPGFWRELGAAVISPPTGFNRLVFGDKFDTVFSSRKPTTFLSLHVGGTLSSSSRNVSSAVEAKGAVADFTFSYGLPGKPGYRYSHPFDYFDFHVTAVSANALESLNSRGMLWGMSYDAGDSTRGIWGLYGNYDYISPQVFRVSNTALSLGTTWQSWLSQTVALQGTALAGAGYGAAGNIEATGERDYHYGVTPHGLLSLRVIFGDRVMLDFTGREYYVSKALATEDGWENILHANSSVTVRLFDRHGVAVRYSHASRNASYPGIEYKDQTVGTVSVMYVFLGDSGFGAVEWR